MLEQFYDSPPNETQRGYARTKLGERYPFLKGFSLGRSVLGREITAFSLGGKLNRCSLYVGGVHGMEWLTTLSMYRFLEELCESILRRVPLDDIQVTRAVEERPLVIIPCLNPDGVEISLEGAGSAGRLSGFVEKASGQDTLHWQANARGVDLNHNFDAGFTQLKVLEREQGYLAPGPTRYGGPCPFSEPESRMLAALCHRLRPRQAYAFHSQGEEIYYEYGEHTPECALLMAQLMAAASGYEVARPDGIASHGGFKDWFIQEFHRPGFTIEMGKGVNPLPIQEFWNFYQPLRELLLLSLLL